MVIVGGPHSGVGKTLAAELAVRTLAAGKPVGAIKLTVADGERDPSHDHGSSALVLAAATGICGRGASCGVCETVSTRVPSRLVTAEGAIGKPGTDTWRLHEAGAAAVAWVISLREAAPRAVHDAIAYLEARGARAIVIEGTTAMEWIKPVAAVMVATDPGRAWKAVARRYAGACDVVLRNIPPSPAGDVPAPPELWQAHPLECDLGDESDPGRARYIERLRQLCSL
jgi:molybdopterin-guanine dinucleotide biosynthesis protein